MYKPLIDGLSVGFRAIAPDLPGFGGSEMLPYINAVGDYSGFVLELMDALGIEKAHIVGNSIGGWIACWFAVDFPGRIDRLVLISPAGLYFEEAPPMPLSDIIAGIEAACAELGEAAAQEFEPNARTLRMLMDKGGFEPDLISGIRQVKAPTLILWGDKDVVIPPVYAGAFMAAIEGSAVRIISGAGHVPHSERPLETAGIIIKFLHDTGQP